jgi:hypothetical protein
VWLNKNPDVVRSVLTERLGVGNTMPREVLWRAEWAAPMAMATNIENQCPNGRWIIGSFLVRPGRHDHTKTLG